MKLRNAISLAGAVLVSLSISGSTLLLAQATGKIHGKVTDPTGLVKKEGTISLSQDGGLTLKYNFPVSATGEYSGDAIPPGTYTFILRMPDTPKGKVVDQIENVKIVAGVDLLQDDDMSREEYLSKLTPEERKQVEEFKKKNAEVVKGNQVVKQLNADLIDARTANHDKKFDVAETLMLKDTGLKPDGELLWYELGIAQIGLKKWDDATASLKKSIDLSTTHKPNPELIAGAHAALGEAEGRNNKVAEAAADYDEAAKAFPAKAGFYYSNETVVFQNAGNTDAQVAAADKAIGADPKNPLPYYLKGQALISKATVDSKTGAYVLPPGCEEAYQKYLDLAPTGPYANDIKAILAQSQTKVESKYKAPKK